MPARAEEWVDPLKGHPPTQAEVDAALADFERLGCQDVYEYLSAYLKMDVKLLGMSSLRFLGELCTEYSIHPVDTGRLSISSFAADAVQKHLQYAKRIAMFSPTHPLIYGVSKISSVGYVFVSILVGFRSLFFSSSLSGLCCVFKHRAGDIKGEEEEAAAAAATAAEQPEAEAELSNSATATVDRHHPRPNTTTTGGKGGSAAVAAAAAAAVKPAKKTTPCSSSPSSPPPAPQPQPSPKNDVGGVAYLDFHSLYGYAYVT